MIATNDRILRVEIRLADRTAHIMRVRNDLVVEKQFQTAKFH